PATNRLTSGYYDTAGNMKSYITASQEYYYDPFGLTSRAVKGGEDWLYVYSADDARFWSYRTAGNGSYFTLRGLNREVLRETALHLGGNVFTDFVYGAGLLAKFEASGVRTDYLVDHLGTPRVATLPTGAVQRYYMYYPYGQEFNAPGTADTFRMRFTGHERDMLNTVSAADDSEYHHARNFSLITARYHSPDPVRGDIFAPQRWNLFSYVGGNPMKRVDPFGREWCNVTEKDDNGNDVVKTIWCEAINADGTRTHQGGAGGGGVNGGRHGPRARKEFCETVKRIRAPEGNDIGADVRSIRSARSAVAGTGVSELGGLAVLIGVAAWDTGMVGGIWNFKTHVERESPLFEPYANYGNYHFGAVAGALGFSLSTTLGFAGVVERWDGDGELGPAEYMYETPEDFNAIVVGWYAADCFN
ncbi:MAG: RHS repeat-associated core domain-containing protein, partial [Thermoanaerobaculia bacterium]